MESTGVEVQADAEGQRLDRFLADRLAVSRARVRHLLEVGRIEHAGRELGLSDKSRRVAASEVFEISGSILASDERPVPRGDLALEVLDEGAGWLVVNKPAGCGVHPLRPDQEDTVLNAVVARHPEVIGVGEGGLRSGVVHRLDVDTTGALVFATDDRTWRQLRGAFTEHRVRKTYLALVAGRFESRKRVEVSLAVTRHSPAHVGVVATGGTLCRQRVSPKSVFSKATLVEIELETGFLHQIRATLAHLGHPILGDIEYAGPMIEGDAASLVGANRPLLHACRLSVDQIAVRIDPPADFTAAVGKLETAEPKSDPPTSD